MTQIMGYPMTVAARIVIDIRRWKTIEFDVTIHSSSKGNSINTAQTRRRHG